MRKHLSGHARGRNFVVAAMREGENELARLAGLARGMKDRAGILFEDLQPVAQIARMTDLRNDGKMRAEERARQFRNEFFARIGR